MNVLSDFMVRVDKATEKSGKKKSSGEKGGKEAREKIVLIE